MEGAGSGLQRCSWPLRTVRSADTATWIHKPNLVDSDTEVQMASERPEFTEIEPIDVVVNPNEEMWMRGFRLSPRDSKAETEIDWKEGEDVLRGRLEGVKPDGLPVVVDTVPRFTEREVNGRNLPVGRVRIDWETPQLARVRSYNSSDITYSEVTLAMDYESRSSLPAQRVTGTITGPIPPGFTGYVDMAIPEGQYAVHAELARPGGVTCRAGGTQKLHVNPVTPAQNQDLVPPTCRHRGGPIHGRQFRERSTLRLSTH